MTRDLTGAVAVAVIVAAGGVAGGGSDRAPAAQGAVSTDASSFALPSLTGGHDVRLVDFRGKPTVVNFFASWCEECRGEVPGFARLSGELRGKVQFVGVNSLDPGDGLAMAREFGVSWWPLAKDVDGRQASGLHDALGGLGMPITAFYRADGHLLSVSPGALTQDALRARLHDLYGI
jgi:thiol-disulfide isomerase/thioredoxin